MLIFATIFIELSFLFTYQQFNGHARHFYYGGLEITPPISSPELADILLPRDPTALCPSQSGCDCSWGLVFNYGALCAAVPVSRTASSLDKTIRSRDRSFLMSLLRFIGRLAGPSSRDQRLMDRSRRLPGRRPHLTVAPRTSKFLPPVGIPPRSASWFVCVYAPPSAVHLSGMLPVDHVRRRGDTGGVLPRGHRPLVENWQPKLAVVETVNGFMSRIRSGSSLPLPFHGANSLPYSSHDAAIHITSRSSIFPGLLICLHFKSLAGVRLPVPASVPFYRASWNPFRRETTSPWSSTAPEGTSIAGRSSRARREHRLIACPHPRFRRPSSRTVPGKPACHFSKQRPARVYFPYRPVYSCVRLRSRLAMVLMSSSLPGWIRRARPKTAPRQPVVLATTLFSGGLPPPRDALSATRAVPSPFPCCTSHVSPIL